MAKDWKGFNKNLIYIDIGSRDAPCALTKECLWIGKKDESHSTLVHKMLYGMDAEEETYSGYKESGLSWRRDNVYDEDVAFGHKLQDMIFWDILENTTSEILSMLKSNKSKIDDYEHYILDPFTGKYSRILKKGRR